MPIASLNLPFNVPKHRPDTQLVDVGTSIRLNVQMIKDAIADLRRKLARSDESDKSIAAFRLVETIEAAMFDLDITVQPNSSVCSRRVEDTIQTLEAHVLTLAARGQTLINVGESRMGRYDQSALINAVMSSIRPMFSHMLAEARQLDRRWNPVHTGLSLIYS